MNFDNNINNAIKLLEEFNVNTVYLFGSASRGELRVDSDVDIAFLSDDDIDLLYRICYHEAHNQSDNGVQAVAEVVLNRVSSNKFPNTVKGVLFAPRQFCSEKELRNTPSSERIEEIVNKLVWGESEYVLSPYAMYFQTTPTGDKSEIKLGDHYFRRNY